MEIEEKKKMNTDGMTKLYDAAILGDLPSLLNLLGEDPSILDRCIIEKPSHYTPLHVAVNQGHLHFIKEILIWKPDLAQHLDLSREWSALHIASSKGYLEIVQILLSEKPNMCFARDRDGRNPVHIAAIYGQIHVLAELLRVEVQAAIKLANGDSILHLCVNYNQPEALKLVLDLIDFQLVNLKDSDGNTALHLAVASKQLQLVEVLLKSKFININAVNTNTCLTPLDVSIHQTMKDSNDEQILCSLKHRKALLSKDISLNLQNKIYNWLENKRSALMVVASLIATMAFQVGINPPGGLWQDDTKSHVAGTSILMSKAPGRYNALLVSNTIGMISSLTVIILLISGLPCKRLFMEVLMFTLWIATTSTTFTYLFALLLIFDVNFYKTKQFDVNPNHMLILYVSLIICDTFLALLLFGHVLRFMVNHIRLSELSLKRFCQTWLMRVRGTIY